VSPVTGTRTDPWREEATTRLTISAALARAAALVALAVLAAAPAAAPAAGITGTPTAGAAPSAADGSPAAVPAAGTGSQTTWGDPARRSGRVTIAAVPSGIGAGDLDRLRPAAIGLMNPGLGDVPAAQTWLDISQGARAFDRDYDLPLELVLPAPGRIFGWSGVRRRAASATLPIRPGLLATVLSRHGIMAGATPRSGLPAIAAADWAGRLVRTGPECPGPGCRFGLTITSTSLDGAIRLADGLGRGDLMIVIESPPALSGDQLAIALVGDRFRGLLGSPGTRTAGYVLSTDIAPTVLTHFGVPVPAAMTGQPLTAEGPIDYPRLEQLEGRYQQVGKRRGAALAVPLLLWAAAALVAVTIGRGRVAGPVLRLLCLSVITLPAVLLFTASLDPSLAMERLIATVLPVLLAAAGLRFLPGYRSLAAACALTVVAYGIDMLAGSVLTPRAVIGPNPGLGARFYGIGNELESTLMILTSVGLGAALTAARERPGSGAAADRSGRGRVAVMTFLLGGLAATVVFAAGRFGADAGAAIVFPVAAVVAAALAAGRARLAWLAVLAAFAGLVVIGLIDLVSGGETHFLRSVFGSGPGGGIADVLRHRLEATADSFTRISRLPVSLAAFLLIALAIWRRDRIARWLQPVPLLAAGVTAAAAGSVVGALTNDSGVLFIQVGVLYLGLVLGFIATTERSRG